MRPLPYHYAVAAILEQENSKAFASLGSVPPASSPELDQLLLRQTYRLDTAGHSDVHAAAQRAADALGLDVPVEVYADEGGQADNAELIYVPERAVLLMSGNTLNLLDGDELCAVAGHELAHHQLWGMEGGRFLAAARLLAAADSDARTPSEYLETARRFRLATELFADRGALQACGSLSATVRGLLKMTTGLAKVDADAYLRQAAEVDYSTPSSGSTHPETVLRAWALQQWVERAAESEADVALALAPQLDLGSLDLLGQDQLAAISRDLVVTLLADDALRSEDSVELAQQYGVTGASRVTVPRVFDAGMVSAETRRYLAAVLIDFATADADAGNDVLSRVIALARQIGLGRDVERMVGADLDLGERAQTKVLARAAEITATRQASGGTAG